MKFARLSGAVAIAIAGAWCSGAGAQSDGGSGSIRLHMPGQTIQLHPIRHRTPAPAAPAETSVTSASTKPTAAPQSQASPALHAGHDGRTSRRPAIPFNFGDEDATSPSGGAATPPESSQERTAALPPATTPTHLSSARAAGSGLSKRGAVLFARGASSPSSAQFDGVKILAGDLATALESGGARVELDAYGGAPGDKSSDARRLSLQRALAVRQLLIDDGVPSNRIDVRAMGGVVDKGPSDRVDVFVRAG